MAAKKNQITYIQKNYDRFTLADFDVKDNLGNTAIYYATQHMQLNVLKLLIECGADVNLRCELGNTALHIAMMVGYRILRNIPIIQTLIGAKANVKIKNLYGQTPVFFASKRVLVENGLVGCASMDMKERDFDNLALPKKIAEKIKEIEESVKITLRKDEMTLAAKSEIAKARNDAERAEQRQKQV